MSQIRSGSIVAFYLFDISETIDLAAVRALVGGPAVAARFAPKPAAPSYLQYEKPPLSFDAEAIGIRTIEGYSTRIRAYDYGVVSVALTRAFAASWIDLLGIGQALIESAEFERRAEQLCREVAGRLRPAFTGYR